jgi:hypothetical protein
MLEPNIVKLKAKTSFPPTDLLIFLLMFTFSMLHIRLHLFGGLTLFSQMMGKV